jgi:hypothetical protein
MSGLLFAVRHSTQPDALGRDGVIRWYGYQALLLSSRMLISRVSQAHTTTFLNLTRKSQYPTRPEQYVKSQAADIT